MTNVDEKDAKELNENTILNKNNENKDTEITNENEKIEDEISDRANQQEEKEDEQSDENNFKEEISNLRDEKLRLLAEMDNLRKRADKEKLDSIKYGSINLARDILSPDDNLTRALDAIPEEENSETVSNLIDGLKMVQREFATILKKHGVKKIDALNMKFDHNFHQAMIEVENDDVEEKTVIQEMQSGYTMHDRLLRPSMVAVSKKKKNEDGIKKDEDGNKIDNKKTNDDI